MVYAYMKHERLSKHARKSLLTRLYTTSKCLSRFACIACCEREKLLIGEVNAQLWYERTITSADKTKVTCHAASRIAEKVMNRFH